MTTHLSEELGVEPNERQPLTPAQERYLKWIEAYTRAEGMPPTYREIADGLGVTNNAVGCALLVLQRKGWIARRPVKGMSRNILLTYQGTYSRFLSDAESRWAGTYTGKPSGQ